jgi:O-antigen ligase
MRLVGVAGAYAFAFFSLLGITPASVGLALLTLAFLADFRHWRALWAEPVIKLSLLFGGYVAVHSVIFYLFATDPARSAAAAEAGPDWLKLLLFVPFAYWAGAEPGRAARLMFLALVGFAIGFLRKVDWASFDVAFFSTRFESYLPAIAFGMFCGLGVLGLVAARSAFWSPRSGTFPRWLSITLWMVLLVLMAEGLFLSFSRGTWLAFTVAMPLLILLELSGRKRSVDHVQSARPVVLASGLLAASALFVLFGSQFSAVTDRVVQEAPTTVNLLQGDWSAIESDSVGLRAHALRLAVELWLQRPWLGWGAGSSTTLIATSERPELMTGPGDWLEHLHSSYAELLVQFGALGFMLMAALLALVVHASWRGCRSDRVSAALCRYLLVSLVFVLIWSVFNYRIIRHDGLFFWIIFAGTAYSGRIRSLMERPGARP